MRNCIKKLGTLLLTLVIIISFMPAIAQTAYAGEAFPTGLLRGGDASGNVIAGQQVYILESDLDDYFGTSIHTMWNNNEIKLYFRVGDSSAGDVTAQYDSSGKKFYYNTSEADTGKQIAFYTDSLTGNTSFNTNTERLNIISSISYLTRPGKPDDDGSFMLTGHSVGSEFDHLEIYNGTGKKVDTIYTGVSGKNDFSFKFAPADYEVGYYNMVGVLDDDTKLDLSLHDASTGNYYKTYFLSRILEKPVIKKNADFFSVGHNYVCFRPYFTVYPEYGAIYMQLYDTKADEWGDVYGPFGSYEILKTSYFKGNKSDGGTKIKANRTYRARVLYAKEVEYNGSPTYVWGPYSNEIEFKTGKSAKPAIKSITAKATKTKKVKLIQHAHWDVNGKWVPYKESYTWATTYKVTVKLKKKPGTTGIYIGNKKVKGNKTTYTATFTDSGKLKGKTIKFAICTYNEPKLGAYGPTVKKKVKIR